MEWSLSLLQTAVVGAGLPFALYLIYVCFIVNPLPASIPRVRDEKKGRFSLKTRLAYYTDCKSLFKEAYEKYSKQGKTCVLPGIGTRIEVILPNRSLKWAAAQPDSVLSTYEGFVEMDQAKYTAGDANQILNPYQGMLVKRDMNRVLETLAAALNDELSYAFERYVGADVPDWMDIKLYETMRFVVGQASSRFTVSEPLCRDEDYLKANFGFGDWFVINAGLLGGLPSALRFFIGPIFSLFNRFHEYQVKKRLQPLYEERLRNLRNPIPGAEDAPRDHLQMILEYIQTNIPADMHITNVTKRILMANFGSFHQTSLAITNVILSILESDAKYGTISAIREEVDQILTSSNGVWTKAATAKMIKMDSIMRETLRLYSFGNRSIVRKVVAPEGIRTEDGCHIPPGMLVSILASPAQTDPDIFKDPDQFDPFRFSRMRDATATGDGVNGDPVETQNGNHDAAKISSGDGASVAFVSTGPAFLPFGHGKHACPGRFLLDFELKMIVAYLVTHYEFELGSKYRGVRPESPWIAEACFPPTEATIRIKSRRA